ncbi:tRNA 2-thiouridine(34) synthase MnmA [Siccirubricoccus sp. KC 17139]|uniref:tRNA-specific 2-thiouridylase MnmA n=1 Tax=Siccirubricoccus soli TaxID=2899147 RepID=A0ABT1D6T1_9PROT|nr:tRNA 2-thiouridine(34) synthase MnmA [Siccirubricoccus soli]MCO6417638.1 tRNA 2-thiouridine(34) synthase MnmA [Siccirubricoccus soli]MCP2683773.1 tRNA 2-thiouridine(34) synthase MnmA [Siccirubricoccus soli]
MRILVAMSGGVDSSVVAGLLKEQGHEVIGATLQLYDHGAAVQKKGACCAGQDIMDARRVADRLDIPHYVLDRETRFRDAVVADFAASYAAGETPIPCIRCNQTVKFHDLVALARDLGAEALATGHYARRVEGASGPELHRAADPARDQSYFLALTTPAQLAFSRFPLGGFPDKATVRAEAARLGLSVAEKPDSQDICFVPAGRYHEVVAKHRPEAAEPGEIVHLDGRVLGRHEGIARYTVGQGRGLGTASYDGEQPLYVAALEPGRRRVVVGPRAALPQVEVQVAEVNWLRPPPAGPVSCQVKLRAREVPQPATAEWDAARATLLVRPEAPAIAAPGQACVLYDGDRVLAGGFIRRAA